MVTTRETREHEHQHTDEDVRPRMVLELLADPDLPVVVARQLADDLPPLLSQRVSDGVSWEVKSVCDPFEAMMPGSDRLINKARKRVQETHCDFAIAITDVPVWTDQGVVVAEFSAVNRVALLSLPGLGGLRLRRRTREVVLSIVDCLATGIPRSGGVPPPGCPRFRRGVFGPAHAGCLVTSRVDGVGIEVVTAGGSGFLRLLAGMVRANRPWQLVLGLCTALAGALTGAIFGVLYSTIWQLGAAMSPLRLAGVTLGAIAVFVFWLIVGHDLWERRSGSGWRATGVGLRNTGTVLTVVLGALMFFLALFAIIVVAAVAIIPPDYLARTLRQPADWHAYLTVALMASVLGTVAGAVGSGLEDDKTVRNATYGYREQQRWREARRDRR